MAAQGQPSSPSFLKTTRLITVGVLQDASNGGRHDVSLS